jgi:hypothetical protein
MKHYHLTIGIALVLLLAGAMGNVEARNKQFHASFAGTCANKDDFSFTGEPAHSCTVAGKSTQGPFTAQSVGEVVPDGLTCPLPGGGSGVGFAFVGDVTVLSFAATQEQLFLHLSPSVTNRVCFDPATNVFTPVGGQNIFEVSDGTGRFAGAKGTIVETWTGRILAPLAPLPAKGFFANFIGTFEGTIEFAGSGGDEQEGN